MGWGGMGWDRGLLGVLALKDRRSAEQWGEEACLAAPLHAHPPPQYTRTQAAVAGRLWALDRSSFRSIVVAATAARREMSDAALAGVELFSVLRPEARAAVADCLQSEQHRVRILSECGTSV